MNKKVLLVVDDEEMNRRIISRFLKKEFDVIEAANGREALEIIESHHVDAVILDIIMPEVDGLEVLTQIRANAKLDRIGVLVATATKEKTERTALNLGADDIVSKPYDPLVIRKRIENVMATKDLAIQKEIAESGDTQDAINHATKRLGEKVNVQLSHIDRCAKIILSDLDNDKIIEKMAEDVYRYTQEIRDHFSKED